MPISFTPKIARALSSQKKGHLACRSAIALFLLLLGISLLIAAWPSQPATPLISQSDWSIQGQAFKNMTPDRYEVRNSIRTSPQTVYWRTWSPVTLATKADIRTHPFKPSPYMAIPYGGFAGAPGIQLWLECQQTGQHLPIASARTNTQMTEALIHVPLGWCPSEVILDAQSQSTTQYIEIGTPFKISRLDYYKNTFIGLIGLLAVVFVFAWGLIFLPNTIARLYGNPSEAIIIGLAIFGLVGYSMFFVFFSSRFAGQISAALLFISEASLLIWLYIRRREVLIQTWQSWRSPTILWAIVVLVAFSMSVATNNGAGPWTVNALFYPVRWSSDNQLPMQISEYLFHGLDPRTLSLGPWKISDRPPLAYGLMSMFRLLTWLIASHNDGNSLFYQYEQMSGIVINGLWVVALYYLLLALKLARREIYWITLVVGLTPFAIFNSIYIWPKMLGAAFALFAFIELFEPARYIEQNKHERFGAALLWAALFSGFALLSHGGTAFGIIAAILVAAWYRGLPSLGLTIRAGLIGSLILVPWALWQHLEQPPGNALVKYAFSGTFGFGEEDKSILASMHDAYIKLTLSSWIEMKLNALRVLFSGQGSTCGLQETGAISSYYGLLRYQDFFYFGPSLRFLALGFVPLLFGQRPVLQDERKSRSMHYARIMACTGLLGMGLYSLFGFDCYINHSMPYQAILEILAALALALYSAKKWYCDLIINLSIGYTVIVWIIDPLASAREVSVLSAGTLIILAVLAYRWRTLPTSVFKKESSRNVDESSDHLRRP
jgi:hypothetical protein